MREDFSGAQWDSLKWKCADLVAAEPFHIVAQCEEELADFALLAVVEMDVELRGGIGCAGRDEGGVFDFELLAFEGDAAQQLAESISRVGLLERDVVAFDHGV